MQPRLRRGIFRQDEARARNTQSGNAGRKLQRASASITGSKPGHKSKHMKNHTFRAVGTMIVLALTAIQIVAQSTYESYTFTTLAAGGGFISPDTPGSAARHRTPSGVAVDSAGNVYVADTYNNTIRKLTPIGTNWMVTTLGGMSGIYGTADGTGRAARFSNPNGVAVDGTGNIYVADFYFNTIRIGHPPPMILN